MESIIIGIVIVVSIISLIASYTDIYYKSDKIIHLDVKKIKTISLIHRPSNIDITCENLTLEGIDLKLSQGGEYLEIVLKGDNEDFSIYKANNDVRSLYDI